MLQVALELFSERGFHATTVQAIVQRAGVTKGAFYHHFESKEDVLRQVHAEYAGEMVANARDTLERDIPPIQQLRLIIERAVISLGNHRDHVAVFYQEYRFLDGTRYAGIREMHEEESSIVLEIIDRAKRAGEARKELDPKIVLFAISGVTAWIYQWYDPSGPLALEEIAAELADIILGGVATPEAMATLGRPKPRRKRAAKK
jgi:TetR/AcrR family transcriptional regulator, cholesterol catabolism regulator